MSQMKHKIMKTDNNGVSPQSRKVQIKVGGGEKILKIWCTKSYYRASLGRDNDCYQKKDKFTARK